ncbi:RNA polymerase sigma factor [Tuwongella immobilis]|uniref:RNA polymerase sigma factor 70 region 4 type 2 domain-containing protein n=1 Tax=Tuwongella immobilis TaxID=692036 RepID=A0A6C2YVC0_9BACT|nr:sigma-70 family RNA polymerase sigma factor [Tuwongella immobilis]VIP05341.1 rna polymerase sigma factor : RNA polymerase, sigma-24 subunit, ECF subfamily OS=Fibrella aestuarina BUZ 2 GN=FAES_1538 PE=4 SV=1: Sigma70_r4_2 [Tuwongella immobilis]VTS08038.1 rna polymerase sigma factor : RNA polymerase, sigma-24 subunit, ECF subfamily OS=Fibrella aestuarina BUZ 2 GN=FAES_1538 PE=4 SV=1: Sigma70_r4_2 [Tuwongella immobilis]
MTNSNGIRTNALQHAQQQSCPPRITLCQNNEVCSKAMDFLFHSYVCVIYGIGCRFASGHEDDVVQRTVLKILQNPGLFDSSMNQEAFIRTIAFREAMEIHREEGRFNRARQDKARTASLPSDSDPQYLAEVRMDVQELLESLPTNEKAVVRLVLAGISSEAGAASLQISISAFRSRKQRAFQRLRRRVAQLVD